LTTFSKNRQIERPRYALKIDRMQADAKKREDEAKKREDEAREREAKLQQEVASIKDQLAQVLAALKASQMTN